MLLFMICDFSVARRKLIYGVCMTVVCFPLTVGSVLDDAMLNANQIYLLLLDICVSTNALE